MKINSRGMTSAEGSFSDNTCIGSEICCLEGIICSVEARSACAICNM